MNILEAMADEKLFATWFKDATTWRAWFAFMAALFGLPMTADQLATYKQCTGRTAPPTMAATEAWLICGRRAGKSFMLALVAVFLACFADYRRHLQAGERAAVLIIATDKRQARVIFRYVRALLRDVPMLARMVERETAESFDLTNSVSIEIQTANYKSVRGHTIAAALADELAFWPTDDSAQPDFEILDALRPGMVTIPNAILLCASSPYAKRGALHDAHRRHHGKDGDPVLVWQAATRTMNPTVPESIITAAIERDASSASAEWLAQFRDDLQDFVARETVLACVDVGVRERAPVAGTKYLSFTDPSGGSVDSMTAAVGHVDGAVLVIDAVREIPAPFNPDTAVDELAGFFKSFGLRTTTGDRYSGQWCSTAFEKRGITYMPAEMARSAIYLEMLPKLNAGTIRLLDHARAINQIASLERRTSRAGRDTIDHPPSGHDDLANVIGGIAALAGVRSRGEVATGFIGLSGAIAWPGQGGRGLSGENNGCVPTGEHARKSNVTFLRNY